MFKRKIALSLGAALLFISAVGCQMKSNNTTQTESSNNSSTTTVNMNQQESDFDLQFTGNDLDIGYDKENSTIITFNGTSAQIDGNGATVEDNKITITSAGTYIVSGSLDNGQLIVNAGELDKIKIVLEGANIHCDNNAPISIKQADKVFITLAEETQNTVSDGSSYELSEDESTVDAAIFSKADVTFNGSGSLTVNANYGHGIVSKDDLVITGGTYNITSNGQGLTGKDRVKIKDGTFVLNTKEDAVKSNQTDDTTKGYIYVENGTFTINSSEDGFDAETGLIIVNGTYEITTGGGSENAEVKVDTQMGGEHFQGKGEEMGTPPEMNGEMGTPPDMNGEMGTPPDMNEPMSMGEQSNESESVSEDISVTETTSQKGLKAGTLQIIKGGTFKLDTVDDGVHCNGNLTIEGGDISIATGDDGIHAEGNVIINDGTVDISKSYEGVEGYTIVVNGGTVNVVASDDGFNATDGTSTDGIRGMQDPNNEESNSNLYIKVTGGTITITASGDGIDSNGDFIVEGGDIVIYGPENGGNGAIDYAGSGTISGGSVLAIGYSQMAQGFSDSSTQYSFLWNLDSIVNSGQEATIKNSSGDIIYSWTSEKSYNSIVFSCSDLVGGEVYTIEAGDIISNLTLESVVTSNGGMGMQGGKQPGGMRGEGQERPSKEGQQESSEQTKDN